MSEVNNTPESIDDGIPEVEFTLEVHDVQQAPVDPTLTIAGEAADAKATGDAIAALRTDLEEEIEDVSINVSGVANTLFPVGSVYISTSASAPTFGKENWRWQEILIPTTWGDLEDGQRSYTEKAAGVAAGSLHFWLRIEDAEEV